MTNRRAVVTGATSGIGFATACRLRDMGFGVLGTFRSAEGDDLLRGAGIEAIRCDVMLEDDRSRLVRQADGCDVLVCSAGGNSIRPLSKLTDDDWDYVFDLNARSVFWLNRLIGPSMKPGGAIVNVSSTAAKSAVPEIMLYAAAKSAVLALTRGFAAEFAPSGVRVNAVLPKIIDTPMQRAFLDDVARLTGITPEALDAERIEQVPLGRSGTADECAQVICFLASGASSYVTGQAVNVCGGWLMSP